MLSNAYFLAKFRFDTAENEPNKNLQNFANLLTLTPNPRPGEAAARRVDVVMRTQGASSGIGVFESAVRT